MHPPADRQPSAILPAAFYHPLHLLWIAAVPLAVLLLINCQAAWFAWDEIKRDQQTFLRGSLILNAAWPLLVSVSALAGFFLKRRLTAWWFAALLVANIAFAWLNIWLLDHAIPSWTEVPDWIFDYGILLAAQFACAMPLCFYALAGIACAPLRMSFGKDITVSVVLMVAPPVIYFLLILSLWFEKFWELFPEQLLLYGGIIFFIVSGVAMMLGLLRLLTRFYIFLNRFPWVLVTVSALLMPLGGLALNYAIPFPSNLQTTGIYVWTLVNAAALLLGCVPALKKIPALWLAQMLTFPFTLYFFILFLPWLPLFMPAMIASGAGFLILTPTVLFMVHGQRLIDGFKHSAAMLGKPLTVTLGLAALLALPAWFGVQAALDRAALRASLDYVYHSDPFPRQPLTVSLRRVTRTLEKLNNYQEGQYLPILSNFYNWSVFDNLFLPDNKMKEMYLGFSGKELPAADADRMTTRSLFPMNNRVSRNVNVRRPIEFPREKISTAHTLTVSDDGDCQRATLTLSVTNSADEQNEYVAKLKLSPAVMVSGLRLLINGEKVDGRLFEQKTALWVYNQIRDRQRRDPALLRYTADDEVELRVFPLEKKETRVVEVEFIYPRNSWNMILLNKENILPADIHPAAPLIATPFSSQQLMLTQSISMIKQDLNNLEKLPLTEQKFYEHFIIERSAATKKQTADELVKIITEHAVTGELKITLANYESKLLTHSFVTVSELAGTLTAQELKRFPAHGGFLRDKITREETLAYQTAMRRDQPATFLRRPVFLCILSGSGEDLLRKLSDEGGIADIPLTTMVLAAGDEIFILENFKNIFVPADRDLEIYDADRGGFVTIAAHNISVITNETYQRGAAAFALQDELNRHPSRAEKLLPLLIKASRESGVMVPATAYIVVERSAQWKILSEKEKQKLAANQSLELEADVVPEPATWTLLLTALVLLSAGWLYRRRTARISAR